MDLGIKDRTALLTASSRGLGKACALALAAEGVNVFINGLSEENLDRAALEIRDKTSAQVVTVVAASIDADSSDFPVWAWVPVALAGALLVAVSFMWDPTLSTRTFLTGTMVTVVVLGALAGVTFVDGWARWNYEGYEAKEPWPEYEALMAELDALPDGRVQWESNSELNKYGTPMSPMLIPYWTEGTHPSMEGLYFESSLTTPFHFINHSEMSYKPSNPIPGLQYHTFDMERGLRHMDVYGVEYYVSFTPEAASKAAQTDGFEQIAVTEPFHIFSLPDTDLVVTATHQPSVYEVPDRGLLAAMIGSETVTGADGEPLPSFHDLSLEWYEDVENMDRWVVADGPEEWPRIETLDIMSDYTRRQVADFVAAINEKRAPLVDGREGRKAVAIIRAADAGELPPRMAASPDFYLCRTCPYARRCCEGDA